MLRDQFRRGKDELAQAEAASMVAKTDEDWALEASRRSGDEKSGSEGRMSKVPFEDTTVAQKLKLGAALDQLNSEMTLLVSQFAHDCSDNRARSLYATQEKWEDYRRAEGEFSSLLFEGGTGAQLLGMSRMIELTEQRMQDLRLAMAESKP